MWRINSDKVVIGFVINNNRSLVNRAHFWVMPPLEMLWILGLDLKAIASVSIAITNRRGERGHPCLVPLLICKRSDFGPCLVILAERLEYNAVWRVRNVGPQFHFLRIWNRKGQDKESKALCRSSDNKIPCRAPAPSQLECSKRATVFVTMGITYKYPKPLQKVPQKFYISDISIKCKH